MEVRRWGVAVARVKSHKIRRIYHFIRQIDGKDRTIEIYLHVYYGMAVNNDGNRVPFINSGTYRFEAWDKDEYALEKKFTTAFNAFTEKGVFSE